MLTTKIIIHLAIISVFFNCFASEQFDNKINVVKEPITLFPDEIETCVSSSGAFKIAKTLLAPTNSGKIEDIKFYPVLFDDLAIQSNYDVIRERARKHVIYFKNIQRDFHGDLSPFLTGKVFVLAHGYIDSMDSDVRIYGVEWPLVVAEAWARYGEGNVLIVDWRVHAQTFYTNTVATEIFKVADAIFDLLDIIRAVRGDSYQEFYGQVHGAGHSLGAQIMGILGNRLRKKFNLILLGRIYALDPAGFWIHNLYGEKPIDNLELLTEKSALLVMVLHTTRKTGVRYVIGHYDFYAYVAEGLKDWCPKRFMDEACEHIRAPNLFKAAMEPTKQPEDRLVGFKCHDLGLGTSVRHQKQAVFGLDDPNGTRGNAYYLPIGNRSPYNYVPDKLKRDMKWCKITKITTILADKKSKIVIKQDIEFTSEKNKDKKRPDDQRVSDNIKLWWAKCKPNTPSPYPVISKWNDKLKSYKNELKDSNQTVEDKLVESEATSSSIDP